MKFCLCSISAILLLAAVAVAQEMSVVLTPSQRQYVVGEAIEARFEIINVTHDVLSVATNGAPDLLIVEASFGANAATREALVPFNAEPYCGAFNLNPGKRLVRTAELDKWFPMLKEGKYFVKAVLVHNGIRYESRVKSFDIVGGIRVGEGLQMFSQHKNLKRTLRLVYWNRNQMERLFLRIWDEPGHRIWDTIDLGMLLRTTDPRLDISPEGEVTVVHRATQDSFLRTLIWSMPEAIDVMERNPMIDPEISATERAKALYNDSAAESKEGRDSKPWWHLW